MYEIKSVIIASAVLILMAGCAGESEPAMSGPPMKVGHSGAAEVGDLTPAVAAQLVRDEAQFREPVSVEVLSKGTTSLVKLLEKEGYLHFTNPAEEEFRLTDKAVALGARQVEYRIDAPMLHIPVGERQLVEVLTIETLPMLGTSRRLEFTYRQAPAPIGAVMQKAGLGVQEAEPGQIRHGKALVGLYDDGWKIEMITL